VKKLSINLVSRVGPPWIELGFVHTSNETAYRNGGIISTTKHLRAILLDSAWAHLNQRVYNHRMSEWIIVTCDNNYWGASVVFIIINVNNSNVNNNNNNSND
jgi:hypothetical protein